jgi:hypothetical protein
MPGTVNDIVGVVCSGKPTTCTCRIARSAWSSQSNNPPS